MTPEERLNAAVQVAFAKYRNEVEDGTEANFRRLRNVRESVSRMVGSVSEVNWLTVNYLERK